MGTARVTGAELDANLTRRNVPAVELSNTDGATQRLVEVDDKKDKQPVGLSLRREKKC